MSLKSQIGVGEWWTLFLLGSIYTVGELGHFLLGSISGPMARELHFGDKACLKSPNITFTNVSSDVCSIALDETQCGNISVPVPQEIIYPCEWIENGLGLAYHILAGPAFMAVFTSAAIVWGYLADKWNRVRCLSVATFFFSVAIMSTSFATEYWQVFLSRMALATWESSVTPIATVLIADLFPRRNRGLAMGLFHWGIYIGYGSSFTIGNHVTAANIYNSGWRASYFLSGLPGFAIALLFFLTAKEPVRTNDEDEESTWVCKKGLIIEQGWNAVKNPALILLVLAACVRHSGGFCWGYNSALYFKTYYPDYDVSLYLTIISIGSGVVGCFVGGWLSDSLVRRNGISARAFVLFASQLIAAPFAFAQFFVNPPTALYFLLGSYLAAELWFGVMFALLVELVPSNIRSKAVAVALFFVNNVGGSTPVMVSPLTKAFSSYRTALVILYPGALFTSSLLFFACWMILRKQRLEQKISEKSQINKSRESSITNSTSSSST